MHSTHFFKPGPFLLKTWTFTEYNLDHRRLIRHEGGISIYSLKKKKHWSPTTGISGSDDVTKEFFSNSVFSIELIRKIKGSYLWAAYRFDSGGGRPSNNVIHRARCGRMRRRHQACQLTILVDQARISKIFSYTYTVKQQIFDLSRRPPIFSWMILQSR